jgi:hypothetical protein
MLERYLRLYKLQVRPITTAVFKHAGDEIAQFLSSKGHALCMQAGGQAFRTPEELLSAVDLYDLTQRTFRDEVEVRQCRLSWQV